MTDTLQQSFAAYRAWFKHILVIINIASEKGWSIFTSTWSLWVFFFWFLVIFVNQKFSYEATHDLNATLVALRCKSTELKTDQNFMQISHITPLLGHFNITMLPKYLSLNGWHQLRQGSYNENMWSLLGYRRDRS